jgi:hypothetical protein
VISHITPGFRKAFRALPPAVRQQAREAYRRFQQDPYHPGLRFKQVHPTRAIYSARISRNYRTLGVRDGDTIVWFWFGSHADYDQLISQF